MEVVVVVLLGSVDRMCFRDPRRMMVVVGRMVVEVVVVQLGGVDRMCFRDPRRMMVVVGRIVDVCNSLPHCEWQVGMRGEMMVVVLLGGVDRMCFRDPRRMIGAWYKMMVLK